MWPIFFNQVTEWHSRVLAGLSLIRPHGHQEAQPALFPASAPGQLWHSAALQSCQAEEGTPMCMTCQEPCWGPSVCSAAEFHFHPCRYSLPVLSCGCQHLHLVTHHCCGSPCSSSRVAGSWWGHTKSLAGSPNSQPKANTPGSQQLGHLHLRPSVTPSCLAHQHTWIV